MKPRLPKGIERRLPPLLERAERFLKEWEWTWTKAAIFCLGFAFLVLISMAVIPSFWIYFANQKLRWDGSGPNGFWLKNLRDAVAMGLTTGPFITFLVAASLLQNIRRKLRGETGGTRPTGGYR